MPKHPGAKMHEWRFIRIRSTPAAVIGHVEAPDAEQASKEAIRSSASRIPSTRSGWQPSL